MTDSDAFSQLARYETLFEMSARINTRDAIDDVSAVLASRLKYVVDIFAWRYLCFDVDPGVHEPQDDTAALVTVDGFRTKATLADVTRDALTASERAWLDAARMQLLEGEPLARALEDLPETFRRDDLTQVYVHPQLHAGKLQALFLFAKRRGPLTELDYKFLRALAQTYHDKMFHLRRDAQLTDALRREIDERIAAQQALQEANEHLEERVAQRTAELRDKNLMLQELTDSFGRFVPHEYLEFLDKKSILDVRLGDHVAKEMAVLFSDIRSFTTLSERMTPRENFAFVNAYLRHVSPVVRDAHGIIVKFLGDGMMAIFPRSVGDAVRAGIETLQRVTSYNAERIAAGEPPIEVGIGVHVGHMMVGMVGEEERLQGDAFSDTVNLTQRVEGLTKFYGASMIVSGDALAAVQSESDAPVHVLRTRYLDRVVVKGRAKPIDVHDVLNGLAPDVYLRREAAAPRFGRAVAAYRDARFETAAEELAGVLEVDPSDRAAALYLERIDALLRDGVPAGWEPVTYFDVK